MSNIDVAWKIYTSHGNVSYEANTGVGQHSDVRKLMTYCVYFRACKSYPKENIVPRTVTDASITSIAKSFRSSGRFPSVVWRLV